MTKVKTIEDLIKYCFYTCDGKVSFGFNECWEVENDENIDADLIKELKRICPDIMDKGVFSTQSETHRKATVKPVDLTVESTKNGMESERIEDFNKDYKEEKS